MNHTTKFLVKGTSYFVAHLNNGGIRIGMTGCRSVDIPIDHAFYDLATTLTNEEEAEYIFDALIDAGCFNIVA